MTAGKVSRIAKLEDEIKQRDRRIAELRAEIDELGDLVERMEENVEDANTVIERSREWLDDPFWDWTALEDYRAKYNALVRDWNAVVPLMRQQPVGRPLAASDEQIESVLKLRRQGMSLRAIAEETSLGLNTVRTIVDRSNGTGRTMRRWRRIEFDREAVIEWRCLKRKKETIAALPKQAQHVIEQGQSLLKETKASASID
jgi:DNA repair exonuclease SbcCD ATPase subunit